MNFLQNRKTADKCNKLCQKNFAHSNEKEKLIIAHVQKSLLFNNGESRIKQGNKLFDVTMDAYDGAEVCELDGCFILSDLSSKYNKENIGLYRDDGLAISKNISVPQSEKIKKAFQKAFKKFDFEIVIRNTI